jgi:hypothetical protein
MLKHNLLMISVAFLSLTGCADKPAAPKTDLTEKEKQQIRELNEQRASEWGTTKRN